MTIDRWTNTVTLQKSFNYILLDQIIEPSVGLMCNASGFSSSMQKVPRIQLVVAADGGQRHRKTFYWSLTLSGPRRQIIERRCCRGDPEVIGEKPVWRTDNNYGNCPFAHRRRIVVVGHWSGSLFNFASGWLFGGGLNGIEERISRSNDRQETVAMITEANTGNG